MRTVFVCNTTYHLLITLVMLTEKEAQNGVIVLDSRLKHTDVYYHRLHEIFNIDVAICDYAQIYPTKASFLLNKTSIDMSQFVVKGDQVFVYNDANNFGYYLHKNKIPYILREDGYDFLKSPKLEDDTWIDDALFNIKRMIKGAPRAKGFSKFCKEFNVNSLDGVKKDSRSKKMTETSRTELFNQLSDEKKAKLFKLFDVAPLSIENNAALIITQPLYTQNIHVNQPEQQLEFYKEIVEKLQEQNYVVYIKVHPRDDLDYTVYPNVKILPAQVPLELIDLMLNTEFEIGITHSSTALAFVGKVKRKMILLLTEEFSKHNRIVI
ncbi:hypothetical protein KG089_03570 [Carnobacteriaceae bacterium zg-ZUI252]|nr:hypothetical protein [Carnobacteriaceae bacterium zg-ZUI252]QTU83024.1 hypothetical protein J7S27_00420 [Carnobacteriaceae bacterium zg-C25]